MSTLLLETDIHELVGVVFETVGKVRFGHWPCLRFTKIYFPFNSLAVIGKMLVGYLNDHADHLSAFQLIVISLESRLEHRTQYRISHR